MKSKKLLEKASEEGLALTFDDVRLKTGYSEVRPDNVSLVTKFSRNVELKIPLTSAAMDTVTEYKMAIALAKLGGIGVIHKNLSIEEQASQVAKVKLHLNGLIDKPICVFEDQIIKEIFEMIKRKKYVFRSFPVLNRDGNLVGIVTGNDFQFCNNTGLLIKEIMTADLFTAPEDTTLDEAYEIMKKHKKKLMISLIRKKN